MGRMVIQGLGHAWGREFPLGREQVFFGFVVNAKAHRP
jgi:hypothetical protein